MRPFGSAVELENRRRLAVTRVLEGYSQAEVARFLGVNPRTVRQWVADYRRDGEAGLDAKPQPGRTPKLSPEQERVVLSWFRKSPTEFGFLTELWTAPRVAQLIEATFGIHFHPRYLNEWLTARDITPQKPKRQARERDQDEIDRWIDEEWPRIQKKGVYSPMFGHCCKCHALSPAKRAVRCKGSRHHTAVLIHPASP